LANRLIRN